MPPLPNEWTTRMAFAWRSRRSWSRWLAWLEITWASQPFFPLGIEAITVLAAPLAVNGGAVEKPPETVLPERQRATAVGPTWGVVATVKLACFVFGTSFWQYTETLRVNVPERL